MASYTKEEVYEILKNKIINFEIEPGTQMGEIDTSEEYHLSRTPIRDVFKKLEENDLLEIIPHVGTFVSLMDISSFNNTLYVREKLEISIIEDLMVTLSPNDILILEDIIFRQIQFIKDYNPKENNKNIILQKALEFISLDDEFHKTMFKLTGKEGIWNHLFEKDLLYRRFRIYLNTLPNSNMPTLVEEHKELLDAIIEKNKEKTIMLMSKHIYGGIRQVGSEKINQHFFKK